MPRLSNWRSPSTSRRWQGCWANLIGWVSGPPRPPPPLYLSPPAKLCLRLHPSAAHLRCLPAAAAVTPHLPFSGPAGDADEDGAQEGQEGVEGLDWRYGSVDDLDCAEWQVPPHCIPIHANVTTYDWSRLVASTQFDVIMMDPPWQLATANPTRGVALGYSQVSRLVRRLLHACIQSPACAAARTSAGVASHRQVDPCKPSRLCLRRCCSSPTSTSRSCLSRGCSPTACCLCGSSTLSTSSASTCSTSGATSE